MARKEKAWWIWQERKEVLPWSIHLKITKDGRSTHIEGELFAEWICNDSHKLIFETNMRSLKKTIREILDKQLHPLNEQDETQLDYEIRLIKESFK